MSDRAMSGRAITGASACPGDDTLIAMVEHALPPARLEALADHVDGCPSCRATIGHLAAVAPPAEGPALVGRYRLEEQLGVGGMGIVWAAWDPRLERRVAIKLMRPEIDEHGPARLLREARALAQLQHPHIVAVFDVGEHEGEVFIATELVDGESLDRWQAGRSPAAIVGAYAQAARGLAAAHAMGFVHRDVKPSNLFVARDGRVRVGDFGLAAPALADERAIVGTPAYMAPEQRAGKPVDGRADQFSLCVALAEALTGVRPAADARAFEGVPPALAAVLATGLRADPDGRYVDMAALGERLAAPAAARGGRGLALGLGIAAIAGLAAGGTALVMARRGAPSAARVIARVEPPAVIIPSEARTPAPPPNPSRPVLTPTAMPTATPVPTPGPVSTPGPRPGPPRPPVAPAAPATPTATAPPAAAGPDATAVAVTAYLAAVAAVNAHEPTCAGLFVRFDALGVARPVAVDARTDSLVRARCELLEGHCTQGERSLRAVFAGDGLAAPAVDDETRRELDRNCPTSQGPWRERLTRLEYQGAELRFAPVARLTRALADAERLARDGAAAMTAADHTDLSIAAGWLAEGFARLAKHCAEARRARALATFDPAGMSGALTACLTTAAP